MTGIQSVTHWFGLLRTGDEAAAQKLWERYFPELVKLARSRLRGLSRVAHDPEDVALSAFASFCRQAELGRFPQLVDRDGLWRLLMTLTVRKALQAIRDQNRIKRGGNAGLAEMDLDFLASSDPTPEFAAQVAEEFQRLLNILSDQELANIAISRMEGFSTAEIAQRLDCAPRTIERKLSLVRRIWERENP